MKLFKIVNVNALIRFRMRLI